MRGGENMDKKVTKHYKAVSEKDWQLVKSLTTCDLSQRDCPKRTGRRLIYDGIKKIPTGKFGCYQ